MTDETINPFGQLDAQSAESHFAQFTPEEHAEYQAYLDAQREEIYAAQDSAGDVVPDDVDGSGGGHQQVMHSVNGALASAFEFGYRCAERGMNIQQATSFFYRTIQG